jgi:hypothetical protein
MNPFIFISDSLAAFLGGYWIMALLILAIFIIAFMFLGLDFRISFMANAVLVLAMVNAGWLPIWISLITYVLVIAFGIVLVVELWGRGTI